MNNRVFFKGEFLRSMPSRRLGVIVCLVISFISLSCSRPQEPRTELNYPAPRYPRYLVNLDMDNLLKAARFAVRQPVGRSPLGKMESGQEVYVVLEWGQDMQVWEAIKTAWAERGVTAHALGIWEIVGITKEEYDRRVSQSAAHGNEAWKELGNFRYFEYKPFFPEDIRREFGEPITQAHVRATYATAYFDRNPQIEYFYAGSGGGWSGNIGPRHADKYMGNFIYVHPVDLFSKAA